MKKLLCILLCLVLLAGCAAPAPGTEPEPITAGEGPIRLSDAEIEFPADSGIHLAQEPTFTRVCITAPGVYRLTGSIAAGQIFVDLGEQAANDPKSAVVLILDGAEILCRTAPAILFSNVYEGGQPDSPTGAHILLAQGSGNRIAGSHTEEFDGAVYSRMSMKLSGTGSLRIEGDNEGLCSERHLTIDSGTIHITSGNDGINTNADGISVTTINGGTLLIEVTGSTGEGDGIDSNGAVVINGGDVQSYACADSGDFVLDADLVVQINGGTVIATGNMLDRIADGGQTYAAFSFAQRQTPGTYTLKNAAGETALELTAVNDFQYLLLSAPALTAGTFTLWSGDTQFQGIVGQGGGFFGKIEPI